MCVVWCVVVCCGVVVRRRREEEGRSIKKQNLHQRGEEKVDLAGRLAEVVELFFSLRASRDWY